MPNKQQQDLLPTEQNLTHDKESPTSANSTPAQPHEDGKTTSTTSPDSPPDTPYPPIPPTPTLKPTQLPEPDFSKSLARIFLPFPLQTPYPEFYPTSPTRRRPRHRRRNPLKLAEASQRWQDSYGHYPDDPIRSATARVRWAPRLVEVIGRSGVEEMSRVVAGRRERKVRKRVEVVARRERWLADIRRGRALIREEGDGWCRVRSGSRGTVLWSPALREARRASTGGIGRRRRMKRVARRGNGSI